MGFRLLLSLFLLVPGLAKASKELEALIDCHSALVDKAESTSISLDPINKTPFALKVGGKYFVYTHSSVYTFKPKGDLVILKIPETPRASFKKFHLDANGRIGTVDFSELSESEKASAQVAQNYLDEDSLQALRNELSRQIKSMPGEYQNKYNPEDTIQALGKCQSLKTEKLSAEATKQINYYQGLTKKKSYSQPAKKNQGTK